MNIEKYLNDLELQLLDKKNWRNFITNRSFTSTIPKEPGVYIILENENIVYAGESGNLQARINDFLDTRNHSLRRKLGKNLFNKKQGFIMGTAKIKFPSKIEILLNKHIQKYFIISFLKINLGRKELEERIVNSMQKEFKLNVRGKRKSTIIK